MRWRSSGEAAFEWKLDGARIQVHKRGDEVRVFTRRLNDVTAAVPEVVERGAGAAARRARSSTARRSRCGRTGGRSRSRSRCGASGASSTWRGCRRELPLRCLFFDALALDGETLIDRPNARARRQRSPASLPAELLRAAAGDRAARPRPTPSSRARSRRGTRARMAKALDAPYEAGRRGAGWLKVKQAHTLDLVVLAAEWGNGRRQGWLSQPASRRARPGRGRLRHARQDLQGPDRRAARLADRAVPGARDRRATPTRSTSGRSWWSRSRSTTSRRARTTRAASRCASRGSRPTGPTSGPRRPTRSRRCGRSTRARAAPARPTPPAAADRRAGSRRADQRPLRLLVHAILGIRAAESRQGRGPPAHGAQARSAERQGPSVLAGYSQRSRTTQAGHLGLRAMQT